MNKLIQGAELCPKKYDHREIGKKQNLFSFHEEGPGFPFFHPNGLVLKNILQDYWRREHRLADYNEIESPVMLDKKLWVKSGHWQLYKENMYVSEVDKSVFAIRPMNCPGSMLYYKEKRRSFKELPLRVCELGKVHRDEQSGALHGLLRVRSFVVDDAHIFCSGDQLKQEVKNILKLCIKILKKCGFDNYDFELSVRNINNKEKYLGRDSDWLLAENVLNESLNELGLNSIRMEGEAKFYGPAIDIKIKDSLGRSWQCSSIQMDFNLAERFELRYFDKDGRKQIPYILHRCIFGSLERFIGMLLEHYSGELPIWLSPVQVKVLSIGENLNEYANSVVEDLENRNIRWEKDFSGKNISSKIKKCIAEKIPVVVILGENEKNEEKISYRLISGKKASLVEIDDLIGAINL